ncbi:MAG: amidase [Hyphomonadaceae bacterium]|nr:amidase [Hyphomonadaceae bacterium]OUX95847.1 MAG: amidase [Hyphomonas sp. TMED17]CAI8393690.1 MAG: 6-aminohexanoate-cyclic-dimer hydrolase [Hyphomonas sp. TMED17]
MDDYANYDALGLAELVRTRQISAEEVLDAALVRAEKAQPELNCFANMFPDIARSQIKDGLRAGPFMGVPYPTKDLAVQIKGAPLTNGSRAWKDNVSDVNSVITERFKTAGMTLFGTTTSPEFGLTTSTESMLFGQTGNPWDKTRTSGGSSGGASAAVAAGVVPIAQASDGGGSIRIPAACTGLFGMKPSRGRTPMGPTTTEGWNGQSCTHAVSRTVRDNAALLDATHGKESGSRYDAPAPDGSFLSALDRDPKPLRIAVWNEAPNGTTADADAQAGIDTTRRLLESLGHEIEDASPALDGEALSKGLVMTISAAMAMNFEARAEILGRPLGNDDLEPVTQNMYNLGKTVPMLELMRANQAAIQAAMVFEAFLDAGRYDFILAPTLSRKPDKLGILSLNPVDFDAYGEAVSSFAPWCSVFNQMGAPAMSVPLHWTDDQLPIGMMFGGRCGAERALFQLAGQLERAAPWANKRPPVWVG